MNNVVFMHVLKTNYHVCHEKFGLALVEDPFVAQMVAKISSVEVVHNEIQILTILESWTDVDQERMAEFG